MSDEIYHFWHLFCSEKKVPLETQFQAWSFGNSENLANGLAELVNKKIKTATTSAFELYDEGDKLPEVGEYNIILNGADQPVCIIRITEVFICPYNKISSEHAWKEGEGDRSYHYWKTVHDEFFYEIFKENGKEFKEESLMVCEVFEKVF